MKTWRTAPISALLIVLVLSISNAFADTATWDFYNDTLVSPGNSNMKHIESNIVISGNNNNNLLAGFMDNTNTVHYQCRASASTDGGATWTDKGFIPIGPTYNTGNDPVVATDASGNYYYTCLVWNWGFSTTTVAYWVSTDGGSTWSGPNTVDSGSDDKPWVASDLKDSSSPYRGNIYACWEQDQSSTSTAILFRRIWPTTGSTLTVATGAHDVEANGKVNLCNISVGKNGIVYVTWGRLTSSTGGAAGYGTGNVELRRSFDGGNSFESLTQVIYKTSGGSYTFDRYPTSYGTGCNAQTPGADWGCINGYNNYGIRANPNPNTAIDNNWNLNLAYGSYSSSTLSDVMYIQGTSCTTANSACTFSTAINVVNDGGTATDQFLPQISVSPKTNTIHITALDRRNSSTNTSWQPWHYHCHLASSACTSSSNWVVTSITTQSSWNFDQSYSVGDYNGLTSSSTREAHTTWPDTRLYNGAQSFNIWGNRWTGDPEININAYDTSGNSLTGLAVYVYDSNNNLVANGFTPLLVGVASGGTYTVKLDNYGSDHCTSAGDYPAVTSYSVASWGCQATVSVPSAGSITVNGYYGTNDGTSNSLTVSSADLNDNALTGLFMQLQNSNHVQIGSGYTTVTFSGLSGSGTTYYVYSNNYCDTVNHKQYTFSRWGDGTTSNPDTISLSYNTNIKAYYTISSC